MTEDDEASALAHQQELDTRYEDEWLKDYDAWLSAQIAWWYYMNCDPDWILEHC